MPNSPDTHGAAPLRLRLYVLGNTPSSDTALANLNAIAEEHLVGRYELEVVDVRDEPLRALNEGALVVPTLVLFSEKGDRRLVGDLRDTEAVLRALGIPSPTDPNPKRSS